ncbi:glycosyltransferase [Streptomyces sp. VRA16 Mangrove soil]|uniref:glycosyltransferase n=1 Tax=Streptomyces sp. VRA16 Mangrove soil TaxID=2817434 RepID=UPI0027DD1768|nr:glycosyltransferase [Streptomyces sp. VRA16 Mangrove soil]
MIISPPFFSHARPLSVLAAALRARGADVHFACSPAFADLAERAGVRFVPLTVTRNANTGVAEATEQAASEAARLHEFLDATRRGAVDTLMTQARHRRADMLSAPHTVFEELRALHERLRPDWYVVDQLSYAVTLALHCLRVRYATYCPGHPTYIPGAEGQWFGVPYDWPSALQPAARELAELITVAQDNDSSFTALFDEFIHATAPEAPRVDRAFALASPLSVVYAYPRLPWLPVPPEGQRHVYAGHMTGPLEPLDEVWTGRLRRLRATADRVVLVALGTFLGARDDVLRTVVQGALQGPVTTAVVVAAGRRTACLADLAEDDRVVVAGSVPQQALLPHVDAMVHHGGNNSFTECLRFGVAALILPFSSDQFAIARDAERAGVGIVRDPNRLSAREVGSALDALQRTVRPGMARWSAALAARGPGHAAAQLLVSMGKATVSR